MSLTSTDPACSVGPAVELGCRECGAVYPLIQTYACAECFGPLEVRYAFGEVTRGQIESGPLSIWRYRALLPVDDSVLDAPGLHPGFTRLVRADNLARALGMRRLWVKDDTGNPTHSFKDRVVAVALANGRRLGVTTLACASTGNLANAVAAAAARAGLGSVVFVPSDLEDGKIVTTAVYGGTLVAIDGSYDDVNRLCSEVAFDVDWGFVNVTLRPYYAEGSKTLGYEVAEQLGWRLPEQIVAPIASGSLLTKVDKAFGELGSLGLVDPTPYRVFGAQAAGCAPVSTAWKAGHDVVRPVRPDTIAKSLAIGNPADGPYALDVARRTGGAIEDVTDAEVVEGIRLLAAGQLDPGAETVLLNTGDGLKTLDAVAPTCGPTVTLPPSIDSFTAYARKAGLL